MKRNIVFVIVLGIILTTLIQYANPEIGKRDFLAYWSASHLFVTGDHPYQLSAISTLQQSTRPESISSDQDVINAWNPPWLVLLLSPLGILPFAIAVPLWIFCNMLLIGLALILSWQMCSPSQRSRGILIVFIAGYLFGETISYLAIGQITALVLLGMLLSIWCLDRHLDLLAGAALLLAVIKPQIAYFFLLIVLIWIIQQQRWKVIGGFLISASASLIIFWIFEPSWVRDYISLLNSLPYTSIYTSTIGSFIATIFHTKIFYFSGVILIFFIKPFLRIVEIEGWFTAMNLALLISLPLSPYGFTFDQIVLLPSIVQVISWLWNGEFSKKTAILITGCLISFYAIVLKMLSLGKLEYYYFFVIPVLLLAIYLLSRKMMHGIPRLKLGT